MLNRIAIAALASLLVLGVDTGAMAERITEHRAVFYPAVPSLVARPLARHRLYEIDRGLADRRRRIAEGLEHGPIGRWPVVRETRIEWQTRRDVGIHDPNSIHIDGAGR